MASNLWIPLALAAFFGAKTAMANPVDFSEVRARYKYWDKFDPTFQIEFGKVGVPWQWGKAIAIVESSLGQNSRVESGGVSEDGKSYGLMQFTLATAKWLDPNATISDLNNPQKSIILAAKYFKFLSDLFKGDLHKIIISYNQGQGNTLKGNDFTGDYFKKFQDALNLVEKGKM